MKIDQIVDQLSDKLAASMAQLPEELGMELRKNSKAILQSTLSRLDLVTKDEFDAQTAVLQRTREKLEQLEQQLNQLAEQSQ